MQHYKTLTKDFTKQELVLLESNAAILDSIKQLDIESKSCYSILDSINDNGLHFEINCTLDLNCVIKKLYPWRKGPFHIHTKDSHIFIDTEWKSDIKMRLMLEALDRIGYNLEDREVLDVGCNNGYYMFDLALRKVRRIVGIDPICIFFMQFYFLYKMANLSNISYRLLGVQDTHLLESSFDCILCMGVLYHRQEPLQTLKILKKALKKDGILLLETLIIENDSPLALVPHPTYANMKNVFYIFSPKAIENLALKAGFKECQFISHSYTTSNEQRSTDFISSKSLGDFLESNKTSEGYPPACRGIFVLRG